MNKTAEAKKELSSHQIPEDTIATRGSVYLCPFRASDADVLTRLENHNVIANDPPMPNNPPIAKDYSVFPSRQMLGDCQHWISSLKRGETSEAFAVRRIPDGVLAGGISLIPCQGVEYRNGILAYWMLEDSCDRDMIMDAVEAFAKWCFETKGQLRRIEAHAYECNTRCQRGLIRYGFKKDGVRRHAVEVQGYVMSEHVYGLLKADALGLNPDDFITKFPGPRSHPSSQKWSSDWWPVEEKQRFDPQLDDQEI